MTYTLAKNLLEFARNLTVVQDLDRDADIFYVPIYEKTIKLIRKTLITSQNPTDFFLQQVSKALAKQLHLTAFQIPHLNRCLHLFISRRAKL